MTGWDKQKASDGSPVGMVDFTASKSAAKYLPKGAKWYDFWTNKQYNGGQTVTLICMTETAIARKNTPRTETDSLTEETIPHRIK